MTTEYSQPFLEATVSTFDTMLGCKLTPLEPYIKRAFQPGSEVSGVIGLSGKAKGAVVLNLCRETALSVSEALLGQRPTEINHDVIDAIGELTNIITGVAKAKLEHLALSVSLPAVIIGQGHIMEFPHKTSPICIPFDCPWGHVEVEVGLVNQ
jgi:chemotaxis protein CheX